MSLLLLFAGAGAGVAEPPPADTIIAHIGRLFRLQSIREFEEADRKKKRKKKRRPTRAEIESLL